ncbi:DinB family protein [Chengkuizengella axinellae]|uniref:DinB family protein n=1 Tax=Chengkuizengella axinellae TaxID=3064388 RepID=A0ABT9J0R6_9BACL|nr:DinB family protein [Chengkuizengella sp. 2205SS18-9]MDP5275221.1 DinB family protein [Chengkuizengella sp. 2205SS18-9]
MNHMILEFFEYHAWSYQQLIRHLKELPEDALTSKFDAGFESIDRVLEHVLFVDRLWHARLIGVKHKQTQHYSLNEYREQFADIHTFYRTFFSEQKDLNKEIEMVSQRTGDRLKNTIGEIILTVVNHGSYHRGNITTMLRRLKYETNATDYAYYLKHKGGK